MPKSDERFARQYRYERPPEFPLASPCSGIDHHLSGPNRYALTQIFRKDRSIVPPLRGSYLSTLRVPLLSLRTRVLNTQILAYMLDSLVRVSRRGTENHFVQDRAKLNEETNKHIHTHFDMHTLWSPYQ